jgi:hypothetical protein
MNLGRVQQGDDQESTSTSAGGLTHPGAGDVVARPSPPDVVTFIVRVWREHDRPEPGSWQGVVERIGSERQGGFHLFSELVEWLSQELNTIKPDR